MSTAMEDEIKRWTAKRKSALVMEILQGKTTVAEASRLYDLPPSEIETWVDEAKRGMENALRANPPKVQPRFAEPIKAMIEDNLSFASGRWRTCSVSIRTRCSGCSRSVAGRFGSAQLGFGRGSRRDAQGHPSPTNAGQRICAVSGQVVTAGPRWRW